MDSHDTLLIACKTAENRDYLRSALEERFNLLYAANSRQMIMLLKQNADCIATVILDITQQGGIDEQAFAEPENLKLLSMLPIIAIIDSDSPQQLHKAFGHGCMDAIPLDYEPNAMLHRIENIVQLHIHKQHLETIVQQQAKELVRAKETMIDALSSMIEHRNMESGQHIQRIRNFTRILLEELAECCPEYELDDKAIALISSAASLHDIGKIAIPDSVLMKPGPLTEQERELMKSHTVTGCQIISGLGNIGDKDYLRYAHNICHYHHERWDGKGYPEGLAGDDIPICAQVVGLTDAFDALTNKRAYKEAYSFAKAFNMILNGECGMFSPKLLECFKHVAVQFRQLVMDYACGLNPASDAMDMSLPKPLFSHDHSLERIRAKYYALVHYINGLLIEIDNSKDLMHIIYNPYPEFSWLSNINSTQELKEHLINSVISKQDRSEFTHFMEDGIKTFLDEDLRRSTRYFHFVSGAAPEGELFELSLLRIQPLEHNSRSMAILLRKAHSRSDTERPKLSSYIISDSSIVCRNDGRFTLLEFGQGKRELAGYSREEIQTIFNNSLIELIVPEDREAMRRALSEQLRHSSMVETEFRVRKKDGSLIWVLDKSFLSIGPDGEEIINGYLTDISHTKRAYELLSHKLEQYEIILAQTENVFFQWDIDSDTLTLSDTWEKIFGYKPSTSMFTQRAEFNSLLHPDDMELMKTRLENLKQNSDYEVFELRIASASGHYLWCKVRASALRSADSRLEKIVGIIINIDAEKKAEQLLQKKAERDALTRLLNKEAGQRYAEEYLSTGPRGSGCAMMIIDVDNFKNINDSYGHLYGDMVLSKIAADIERIFRHHDIICRIGGDEFAVLIKGVADKNILHKRCSSLLELIRSTFLNEGLHTPVSCSIGIAVTRLGEGSYFELFRHADKALYMAKARGKNTFCFYESPEGGGDDALPMLTLTPIDSNTSR